ncbi:hypothetical protein OAC89_02010 [Deltaproteobacteria bacterium]|nr:hypothetical protein [Deltaproteobacteria bacterium]
MMNVRDFNSVISVVLLVLIFIFASLFHIPAAGGQEKSDNEEILVIGSASMAGGNVAAARNKAIADALVKGAEEYLTLFLGSQGMISNFPRLINEVIPGAGETIENYNILAEEKSDKLYKILVRIKVNKTLMEEKLSEMGIILTNGTEAPSIKLLFLVSQKDSPDGEISYWWNDPESNANLTSTELVLLRAFQERGFSPVNRLATVPEEIFSDNIRKLDLTDEEVTEWGRLFSSDVVIQGKSEITEDGAVFVSLKAIDIEKNSIIGEDFQIESIEQNSMEEGSVMETLEVAINNIVTRMSPSVIKSFEVIEEEINFFEVEIKGLRNLKQLWILTDFLKSDINGVKSVIQKRIKRNSITVSVEFAGDGDRFLDRVKENNRFPFLADVSKTEEGNCIIEIR